MHSSVSIFTIVSSVKATIEVISGKEGTFRVKCTSFGGKTFTMTMEGPQYSSEEQGQMMVEAVGEPERMGNDKYSATTSVISGGCNEDIYQCTASNGVAPNQTHSVELKGIYNLLSYVSASFALTVLKCCHNSVYPILALCVCMCHVP